VLRAGGTCVVLDVAAPDLPRVRHWGADVTLPDPAGLLAALDPAVPHGGLDAPWPLTVLPGAADGWPGRPALRGHRPGGAVADAAGDAGGMGAGGAVVGGAVAGGAVARGAAAGRVGAGGDVAGGVVGRPGIGGVGAFPRWTVGRVEARTSAVRVEATDADLGLALALELALQPSGVLVVSSVLRNTGGTGYLLDALTPLLPVPARAGELLDLTGRWCREHAPQRSPLHVGVRARETWRGRPGHDGTPVLVAGTPGFGFRHGEVWGVHVAWSGNAVHLAERVPEGRIVIGGGELGLPGELLLPPGGSYSAPPLVAAWSDAGLDGLSARLHGAVRARTHHPRTPRPLVLNTWDAVFFDHSLDRLTALADRAAAVGVERFVLDDGWFTGRRVDTSALGDWTVDAGVWPSGLHPLVEHVRGLGMQFGLWVEPEMVSPDSALARAHPGWILAAPGRAPRPQRHQDVLDLARPDAFAHVLDRLDALVTEYALDALKWDHNRDLVEPVHAGRPGAHAQTAAVYRLMDELRRRHPRLEIESCAAGGGRADLGVLARADRVWGSDTSDPVERQQIQRWTGLLLPPELVGAHVGGPVAWTTGRACDLGFRLVTALFGHAGIEWDLAAATPAELDRIRAWAGLYRELRGLLHSGVTVRADHPGDGTLLHGVVGAPEAGGTPAVVGASGMGGTSGVGEAPGAVFAYLRLETARDAVAPPLLLPGLAAGVRYRARVRTEVGDVPRNGVAQPPWLATGVELTGDALGRVGLAAPLLHPGQAIVLHLTPVG
jgi:alpha-galactosidase